MNHVNDENNYKLFSKKIFLNDKSISIIYLFKK